MAQQERLATVDDLPLRSTIGRRLQFLGHDEGLLDDDALIRGEVIEIRREHGCIILEVRSVREWPLYNRPTRSARIRWRTR